MGLRKWFSSGVRSIVSNRDEFLLALESRGEALSAFFDGDYEAFVNPHRPFYKGGPPDIAVFDKGEDGMILCTHVLTGWNSGQQADPQFELAMHLPANSSLAPEYRGKKLVSPGAGIMALADIATYSLQTELEVGHSVGTLHPAWSPIVTFLLDELTSNDKPFVVNGQQCRILLCIGITQDEFDHREQEGTEALIAQLRTNGVYPLTMHSRDTAVR